MHRTAALFKKNGLDNMHTDTLLQEVNTKGSFHVSLSKGSHLIVSNLSPQKCGG